MNALGLPALTGDSPLGILAAIGVVRLLSDFTGDTPRLQWDRRTLTATLRSRHGSVGALVSDLQGIVAGIPEGSVLPGVGPGFPPPGDTKDGLRVPQGDLHGLNETLLRGMPSYERTEAWRWLASLVTDLAVDSKSRGAISQFAAPLGRQTMITMFRKPLEHVQKNPDYLRQALEQWRRVPGVTGESLDHRAQWDATQDAMGSASMRGVPGATWLALMSYPLLRTTTSAKNRSLSSGWHTTAKVRSRPYDELRLPVWEQPLSPLGVTALIEHPALARIDKETGRVGLPDELKALGVIHVCRARRLPGKNSAGVLATIP